MTSLVDHLLLVIEAYSKASGFSEATLSTKLFNDGKRVALLRAGADINTRTFTRVMKHLSDHWPENADWPAGVDRPSAGGED